MARYGVARGAIWCLEVLGGIAAGAALVGAVLVGLYRPELADPVILAIWALGGLLAGLAAVALAQIVRAMIDTAENTAELVRLMKRGAPAAAAATTPAPVPLVAERGVTDRLAERAARVPAKGPVRSEPPLTRPQGAG